MKFKFSHKCLKKIEKIKRTDRKLFDKLEKQLELFLEQPNHPSLRLHKLSGKQQQCWSLSIDISHRLLFYYSDSLGDDERKIVVFFSFGKHEEVYD